MCNSAGVDVKPVTNTAAGNSTVSNHEIKDSVNTVTNLNITRDALFMILFFVLFLLVLIIFAYNKFYYRLHAEQISRLMNHPNLQTENLPMQPVRSDRRQTPSS